MAVLVTVPAVWLCDWLLRASTPTARRAARCSRRCWRSSGVVVQPLLVGAAVRLGWLGVLLLAFVGQALDRDGHRPGCCRG